MPIESVFVVKNDKYAYCRIDDLSEQLKEIIRDELNIICYGKRRVEGDDLAFYSYQETIKEFLVRYERKTPKIQVGMIGELLTHILITRVFSNLEAISVYFNKEERSIKKGFDLNYLGEDKKSIWYGEVKSGELQHQAVDIKNVNLLKKATDDLSDKLNSGRRSLWETAIIDVALSIASNKEKSVADILKTDLMELRQQQGIARNGVLVSVLFHDTNSSVDHETIEAIVEETTANKAFSDVILFSIQKSTYDKVVKFLKDEIQND